MLTIPARPIGFPDRAIQLTTALWRAQKNFGMRNLCLLILGNGGQPAVLGVIARDPELQALAARLVADHIEAPVAEIRSGEITLEFMRLAHHTQVMNLTPLPLHIEHEDYSLAQRWDPLQTMYTTLERVPPGVIAGISMVLHPGALRAGQPTSQVSIMAWSTGQHLTDVHLAVELISSEYGMEGIDPRRPFSFLRRQAIRRMLLARMPYWRAPTLTSDKCAAYWHPPFALRKEPA